MGLSVWSWEGESSPASAVGPLLTKPHGAGGAQGALPESSCPIIVQPWRELWQEIAGPLSLGDGLLAWVAESRQTYQLSDPNADSPCRRWVIPPTSGPAVTDYSACPLMSSGSGRQERRTGSLGPQGSLLPHHPQSEGSPQEGGKGGTGACTNHTQKRLATSEAQSRGAGHSQGVLV